MSWLQATGAIWGVASPHTAGGFRLGDGSPQGKGSPTGEGSSSGELDSLADGALHLWRWRLDAPGSDRDAPGSDRAEAWLTSEELARAARHRFELPRRRFVAARAGLRRILSSYLGIDDPRKLPFVLGPHGKPALARPEQQWLRFNLAHTADFALCAISREREVGIDVEGIDGARTSASAMNYAVTHFCSPAERRFLAGALADPGLEDEGLADEGGPFLALWTCKEAVGKARGTGLVPPVPVFDAALASDLPTLPAAWQQREEGQVWWVVRIVPFPGTVGALAVEIPDGHAESRSLLTWFDLRQTGT